MASGIVYRVVCFVVLNCAQFIELRSAVGVTVSLVWLVLDLLDMRLLVARTNRGA